MVRGTKSQAPYDIGELDLMRSGALELAPDNSQAAQADADDDARFYASLPISAHADEERASDDDALWADLPSLELAHDPRSVPEQTKPRRSSIHPPSHLTSSQSREDTRSADDPTAFRSFAMPELAPPPTALWYTPRYALQALVFSAVLWRKQRSLRGELADAEHAQSTALVELGRALLSARTSPELAPLQARFSSVDEKLMQRSSVAHALNDAGERRAALEEELARALTELRATRAPYAERAAAAAALLRQTEADLVRAEAQTKRAEIALRAARQAVSLPSGTRLDTLESALNERQSELALLRGARERAASTARAEQSLLAGELAKERGLVEKHANTLAEADKRAQALGKRVAIAGASEEAALRALAQSARDMKLAVLARAASENAEKCARLVAVVESDSERAAHALESVHGPSVIHGIALIMAALALFAFAVFG